jgi:hypothetical protein
MGRLDLKTLFTNFHQARQAPISEFVAEKIFPCPNSGQGYVYDGYYWMCMGMVRIYRNGYISGDI